MPNKHNDPYSDWPPVKQDNGKNWSEAKLTILRILWPMEWVHRDAIFSAVSQTYYDRRIRELRESGWQVETHSSGQMYRLISHEKLPGQSRQYPSAKQKRVIRERDQNTCQICGQKDKNLQFDHKIPFERNGPTDIINLQILCRTCNVEKRGACKNCTLESCENCPFAFPELYADKLTLFLDKTIADQISKASSTRGVSRAHIAIEIITKYFSSPEKH